MEQQTIPVKVMVFFVFFIIIFGILCFLGGQKVAYYNALNTAKEYTDTKCGWEVKNEKNDWGFGDINITLDEKET